MAPDQTAAHSDDRRRHCRTRAASVEPSHYVWAVRISRWRRTNYPPHAHASHHRASVWPHDSSRILAPKFSEFHVVAEGVGS